MVTMGGANEVHLSIPETGSFVQLAGSSVTATKTTSWSLALIDLDGDGDLDVMQSGKAGARF